MSIDLFVDNLLSPPVLFFFLGITAIVVRSDLEIPDAIAKLFSIYLLWAIGIKGGVELRRSGLDAEVLTPVLAAVLLSGVVPLVVFPILRRKFGTDDACALAACYGSVSVVTFLTAADFLGSRGIAYGEWMVAALALMEAPPIIVALLLRQWVKRETSPVQSVRGMLHESLTAGSVFLLLGSLLVGALTGPERFEPLRAFSHDIFHGVLVLFLLEAGMVAGRRMREMGREGLVGVIAGIAIPLVNAAVGIGLSRLLGLAPGNALLFTVLAASASYIAVPAVMRLAVPEANAGLYLPMSLGVTFPFNVCVGIPLYLAVIRSLWPESG